MTIYRTYRHWRIYNLGNACITAACEINKENRRARFAYAFCSPTEKNFSKAKARTIASGRLAKEKSSVELVLPDGLGLSAALGRVIFAEALDMYLKKRGIAQGQRGLKGQVPYWAAKAILIPEAAELLDCDASNCALTCNCPF